MDDAATVTMGINELCLTRCTPADAVKFPPGGRCFRGGGFDDAHRGFFTVGKKYRVPGFLATSFSEDKAEEFLYRAHVESKYTQTVPSVPPVRLVAVVSQVPYRLSVHQFHVLTLVRID
jgi:hypothetical protein